MKMIYPVLLAGGAGTRLWPLSRKSFPKQFSKLVGDTTLFQSSAERLVSSEIVRFAPHITLTNADFRFIIAEQFQEIGIDPGPVLIEPEGKNTAAAILAASIYSQSSDRGAVLLVAPSDHLIPKKRDFHSAISVGLSHAKDGKLVTFGIRPTHPETGYGYLEISENILDHHGTSDVVNFIEKPEFSHAKKMLVAKNFLWNAGIFLFRAQDMIDAFQAYAPKTLELVSKAVDNSYPDLGFLRLSPEPWSKLEDISIDYAIMEKAQNLIAVPYSSKWSDLGGWDAVWSEGAKDHLGNVKSDRTYAIECRNTLLRSESMDQQLVGLGLENIIAVAMKDAVLVADKNRAQDVKTAVNILRDKEVDQVDIFPKDHRPWGWFESLALGDQFQVKRICVKPNGSLSLQSHSFRSEHWIVVEGTAKVTIDDEIKQITRGQSVYVPEGSIHRMENPGKLPMILIEVQTGSYLGEDDIVRYEDIYGRESLE